VIGSVRYDPLPMPAMLRLQRTLVALTAAYIAGFGIYAARASEGRYLLYAPVLILLITIVALWLG
jgi:hypothetical protein